MIAEQKKIDQLRTAFTSARMVLSENQALQFALYWQAVLAWNSKAKLVSKSDENRLLERHFIESAILSKNEVFHPHANVIDVGTGGGFPGLPLKIVRPDLRMTLLDSKRWKTLFLRDLISQLKLSDLRVENERAEVLKKQSEHIACYDVVVCRAVMQLNALYPLVKEFLAPTGVLLSLKGSTLSREIIELKKEAPGLSVEVTELQETGSMVSDKLKIVLVRAGS